MNIVEEFLTKICIPYENYPYVKKMLANLLEEINKPENEDNLKEFMRRYNY